MLLLNIVLMLMLLTAYVWLCAKIAFYLRGILLIPIFAVCLVGGLILAVLCLMSLPRSGSELFIYPFADLATLFVQKFVLGN